VVANYSLKRTAAGRLRYYHAVRGGSRLAQALGATGRSLFMPTPEIKSHYEGAGSSLVLVINSTAPIEIIELQTPQPSVSKHALIPPANFRSCAFDKINGHTPNERDARELELFSMQMARWVGTAKAAPGQPARLSIPSAPGTTWFATTVIYRFRSLLFTKTGAHGIARVA
jgi:hypothetical protein